MTYYFFLWWLLIAYQPYLNIGVARASSFEDGTNSVDIMEPIYSVILL
jgi:hypothetical protein